MQPSTSRLLHSVRQALIQRLAPRLLDDDAQALVGAMDVAICELLNRADGRLKVLQASNATLRRLLIRAGEILYRHAVTELPPAPAPRSTIEELNESNDQLRSIAVSLINELHLYAQTLAEAERHVVGSVIKGILQHQYDEMSAEMAPIPDEPVNLADPLAIDKDRMAHDIAGQLALNSEVQIGAVKYLSGGFSRVTLSVDWNSAGAAGRLVIRKQKPGPIMEHVALGVSGEFPVLRFLHSHGVAVPQPLWLQTDHSVLGDDFIAMECVAGTTLGSAMGAQGVTDGIMRQIAEQLAVLHTLPWEENEQELAHTFRLSPGHIDVRTALDTLLERWEARWNAARLRPSPALSAAYAWLQRNKPRREVRPCLLHGDIGFHNMLFEDGRMTALLDWETAFLGDPAKDIATCQSFVALYTDWDQFLAWYREAGGPAVDDQSVRYYSVLRVFTQMLVGDMGLETKFAADDTTEIEYLFLGGPVRKYFFNDYLTCLDTIAS
jgi:aminoglycoside phosphotransferase (APT) family kinase protein